MKLWQEWHNTDQDGPYFHYGPLGGGGVQKTGGGTGTKKHEVGNKKAE